MASPTLESPKPNAEATSEDDAVRRSRPSRWRFLISGPATTIGVTLLGLYCLAALASFLPLLPDPLHIATSEQLAGPGPGHVMGTDEFGRDQFARILVGIRISLEIILPASLVAMVVGTALGLMAGYFGSVSDNIIMRFVDIFFAFPPVLLALAIIAALGAGIYQLIGAIAIVYMPMFVRIVRGPVLALREREFVQAALAMGVPARWILVRHILPGVLSVIVVQVTLTLSWALLTETALSFLGLGLQPPQPDLGTMLSAGSQLVTLDPWMSIFPGFTIMLAVLGFNLVGDGLRDVLDPRTRRMQEAAVR
jgi:peptide/nickel transport system permease protein